MSTALFARRIFPYLVAALIVLVLTLPLWLLHTSLTWSNISLIYVLTILIIAIWQGTGPPLLAAFISFFASEYFLLEPLYAFAVRDPREFLDLCVFSL